MLFPEPLTDDFYQLFIIFILPQKGERCLCNPGFMGRNCQLGLHDDNGAGQWWHVSEGNPYMPPRTGSAGVYLSSTGAMYLFGGGSTIILYFNAVKRTGLSFLARFIEL